MSVPPPSNRETSSRRESGFSDDTLHGTFAGKELLVTGVTGFFGKVWVALLLQEFPQLGRLHLVVRPKARRDAWDRMQRLFERSPAFRPLRARYGARLHQELKARIQVHEGDCSEPMLGIRSPETVLRNVDAVVHFAGLTDFQPDPAAGLPSNVHGALHAADVAERLSVPRLIHISTAFVAGNQSGRIPETQTAGLSPTGVRFDPRSELKRAEATVAAHNEKTTRIDKISEQANHLGYPNGYTFTKALAEHLLLQREKLQLTLLRPAIIESAVSFPFAGWNEGVNTSGPIVWLLSSLMRGIPAGPKNHFDVVPVDTAAKGVTLAVAANLRDAPAPIVHIASSDINPLTFERAIDLNSLAYRRRYSNSTSKLERYVKRYLVGSIITPERPDFPTMPTLRGGIRELLTTLKDVDAGSWVTATFERNHPGKADRTRRQASQALRNLDRTLKRVEEMLELYKPFIHDNDYIFETGSIEHLSGLLGEEEKKRFAFDIRELCWREYWINVHVPGLETWSIPILKGEKAFEDPPFAAAKPEEAVYSVAEGA